MPHVPRMFKSQTSQKKSPGKALQQPPEGVHDPRTTPWSGSPAEGVYASIHTGFTFLLGGNSVIGPPAEGVYAYGVVGFTFDFGVP